MAARSSTERSSKETATSEPPGSTSAFARTDASCSAIDARTASSSRALAAASSAACAASRRL
eukprot:2409756-Prymnesium_polylepis.1